MEDRGDAPTRSARSGSTRRATLVTMDSIWYVLVLAVAIPTLVALIRGADRADAAHRVRRLDRARRARG